MFVFYETVSAVTPPVIRTAAITTHMFGQLARHNIALCRDAIC
jgi:hypothetical protein